MTQASAPIGVFDSGVGGLDVAAELTAQLPHERMIYLGDTARVPYGTRTPAEVRRFSGEALDALVAMGVKAVVLACNTASAWALDELRARSPVPVLGMVESGVEATLDLYQRLEERGAPREVLILATPRTIDSQAYQKALAPLPTHALACPIFVPLAEAGWTDCEESAAVAARYLRELIDAHKSEANEEGLRERLGVALLGCTHYPLLSASISAGFERALGRPLPLVDGARRVAQQLQTTLSHAHLLAPSSATPPRHQLYTTAEPEHTYALAERFWRARLGAPLPPLSQLTPALPWPPPRIDSTGGRA